MPFFRLPERRRGCWRSSCWRAGALFAALLASTPALASADAVLQVDQGQLPEVVVETGSDWRIYDRSNATNATWQLRYGGHCDHEETLTSAHLQTPSESRSLPKHSQRRLTPPSTMVSTSTTVSIPPNQNAAMQACNQTAQQRAAQGLGSLEDLLAVDFHAIADLGHEARLVMHCQESGIGFQDIVTVSDRKTMPVRVLCKRSTPPPPQIPFAVTAANLEILNTSDGGPNQCSLRVAIGLHATLANQSGLRYRLEHGRLVHSSGQYHVDKSVPSNVSTGAQPSFFTTQQISVPATDQAEIGRLRVVVDAPNKVVGDWVPYELNCLTHSGGLSTQLPPTLQVRPRVLDKVMVHGQLCPQRVQFVGTVRGRGDVSGVVTAMSPGQAPVVEPIELGNGDVVKVRMDRTLRWEADPSTTLVLGGASSGNAGTLQREQSIRFGMTVSNDSGVVLANERERAWPFRCEPPQVNIQPGAGSLNTERPDTGVFTPGLTGGAPSAGPAVTPAELRPGQKPQPRTRSGKGAEKPGRGGR